MDPVQIVSIKLEESGQKTANTNDEFSLQTFTGMTKEELLKYANDPFWQRLRWIFFILFWLLWAAMLAGAVWIILKAPKCSVAKPLPW